MVGMQATKGPAATNMPPSRTATFWLRLTPATADIVQEAEATFLGITRAAPGGG